MVDLDLEKFFDRVNHDKLMGRIAKRIADKRLLKLIRAFLNAGVMENGLVSPSVEGTPQGGPLSPLLSNLVLDELDRELERRGLRFVRYADDSNIYVRSERAGQRVMESITRFITKKLKLKVNETKSAVARPQERKFLGFSFTKGPEVKRAIAPKALERFKKRVREITRRAKGVSIGATMAELVPYLRGWRGYFGFCETPEVLLGLIRWVRCDFGLLCGGSGKPHVVVGQLCWISGSARGWRVTPLAADLVPGISHAPRPSLSGFVMLTSNCLVFLRSLTRNGINSRTAVYGPVRTVVWQGSVGDHRPYADQTLKAGVPVIETIDAFRTIDAPLCRNGNAFCTVNSNPLTFTLNCLSKCSSVICPSGANSPVPAFAKSTSILSVRSFTAA